MDGADKSFEEIAREWMEESSGSLKVSSVSNYRYKLEKHVIPYFAGVPYGEITPAAARRFAEELPGKGYSKKYTEDILVVLRMVTRYASRRYCLANPADSIIFPKRKESLRLKGGSLTEKEEEILRGGLLDGTDLTKAGIYLVLTTGMRLGELCALRWKDIDLEQAQIRVAETLQRIPVDGGTALVLTEIKSGAARRRIPLTESAAGVIGRFAAGPGMFFLTGTGQPADPRTMQNRLKALARELGLPNISFSCLRGTFIEGCARQGMDAAALSRILGNASLAMSLEYCKNTQPEDPEENMTAMREKELL